MPQPLHVSAALQHDLEQSLSQEEECCTAQHQGSHTEAMAVDQPYVRRLGPDAPHGATYDPRAYSSCHTTPTSSSQQPAATQQALGSSSPDHSAEAPAAMAPMLSGSSRRHAPGWRKKAHPYRAPMDLGVLEGATTTSAARPRAPRAQHPPAASPSPRPSSQEDVTQERYTPGVDQQQQEEGQDSGDAEDGAGGQPKRMSQRSSTRSYVPRLRRQRHELTGPCSNCGSATSPQWRKGPPGKPVLCNACGIRYHRTKSLHVPPVRGAALKRNVVVTVGQRPPWLRHPGDAQDGGPGTMVYPEALPWMHQEALPQQQQQPWGFPHTWEGGAAPGPALHGPDRGLEAAHHTSRRHRHHPYHSEQQQQQPQQGGGSTEEETLVGGRSPRRRALSQRALEALALAGPAADPDAAQQLLMAALGGALPPSRGSPASSSAPWPQAQQPLALQEAEEDMEEGEQVVRGWGARGVRGREESSPGVGSTCHMDLLAAAAADALEQDRESCQAPGPKLPLPPAPTAGARRPRPSPLMTPGGSLAELLQPGAACSSAAPTPSSGSCSSAVAAHMLRQASVTGGLALPPPAAPAAAAVAGTTPDYISAVMALKDRTGSIDAALDLLLGGCAGLAAEPKAEAAPSSGGGGGGGEDSSGTARTYVVVRARARGPRRAGSGAERGGEGDMQEEMSGALAALPELAGCV